MARLTFSLIISALLLVSILSGCADQQEKEDPQTTINPSFLSAQGQKASPDYPINLPTDHQAHPAFDIEWWYLTANLVDEMNQPYAFQWTLFRFTNPNQTGPWHDGQTFMAHTSLHTPTQHWFEERFAAGGVGNAKVGLVPSAVNNSELAFTGGPTLTLAMDDWRWQASNADGSLFPATLRASVTQTADTQLKTAASRVDMTFELIPSGPFVLQGDEGYSVKSREGKHASHYYSLPFIDISGTLETVYGIKKLSGKAWYDHEWTSTLLDTSTAGWDWMSLHFDNGDKLMAFSMRLNDQQDYHTGTYISADGTAFTLLPEDISLEIIQYTEVDSRSLPLHWQVSIANKSIDIRVTATIATAYNRSIFGYYEGPVIIEGTHSGVGFLELTGY